MSDRKYQVLLFYNFVDIKNPEKLCEEQRALCRKFGLTGRIIVATEGINATVEGTKENTEIYIQEMQKDPRFFDIVFKKSVGSGNSFPKLSVRVRPELVTSGVAKLNPQKITGKYITADELHQWFKEKREFYLVDMRNEYEYASGYFENFIPSGMNNFFELQNVLPRLAHLKNKTIVTVCTGGIRCEKASGFLLMNGFSDVYQLKDGIVTYLEKYPNEYYKGKLYVFDKRLTLGFNVHDPKHIVVGKCFHCDESCDSYVNCAYDICHKHYIACKDCVDKETGLYFCKKECKEAYLTTQHRQVLAC